MRLPRSVVSTALAAGTLVSAAIVATNPGGPGVVFKTGEECTLTYQIDTDGIWKSMSIDLRTGSNTEMVNVTHVAENIDATTGDGTYSWTCPDVEPNAEIYFYQFTQEGAASPVWTSRFTIAAANGSTAQPANALQPDGSPIPWGIGALTNASSGFNATADLTSGPLIPSGSNRLTVGSGATSTSPAWAWGTAGATSGSAESSNSTIGFLETGSCSVDVPCPDSAPCCSEFGFCGTGRNCLAGCNPLASFKPAACAPIPACVDTKASGCDYSCRFDHPCYTFSSDRILTTGSQWTGDGVSHDWIVDLIGANDTDIVDDDALVLTVSQIGNGTALSSTHSVLYGNVSARIKSAPEVGLVTSFVLLSGTNDEIDWEFTNNLTTAGTAVFYQGEVGDYSAAQDRDVETLDRSEDFHDYGIEWTPESISWSFDGEPVRNVTRESTLDVATGRYHYPSTPARIQLLIWPAGIEGTAEGAVEWAGGLVNWTSEAYNETGYFASYVESVSVACYDASLLNSTASANSTASDPQLGNITAPTDPNAVPSPTSTSTTLWWTPSVTAWWTPASATDAALPAATSAPVKRLRRFINFLVKRADSVPSYSYGDVDENGELGVNVADAITTLTDGTTTGLDMQPSRDAAGSATDGSSATATADPKSSGSGSESATGTATSSASSESATETGKTVQEKWNDLSTAARVGIYVGAAVGALLIVVLIGWLWRQASRSRANSAAEQGTYEQIQGGEMISAGPTYTGTGEIVSGQDLYAGGQAPYVAPVAAPTRKPTFVGGFIPSSKLRKQRQQSTQGYVPPPEAMQQYAPGYTGGPKY